MVMLMLTTAPSRRRSSGQRRDPSSLRVAPVTLVICDRLRIAAQAALGRRGAGVQHRRRAAAPDPAIRPTSSSAAARGPTVQRLPGQHMAPAVGGRLRALRRRPPGCCFAHGPARRSQSTSTRVLALRGAPAPSRTHGLPGPRDRPQLLAVVIVRVRVCTRCCIVAPSIIVARSSGPAAMLLVDQCRCRRSASGGRCGRALRCSS